MKKTGCFQVIAVFLFWSLTCVSQIPTRPDAPYSLDKVQALKDTLLEMTNKSNNELFKNNCEWFIQIVDAQPKLTDHDSSVLSAVYDTFCLNNPVGNCRDFSTYLNRQRPLTIAWKSPTDGVLSFAKLYLPKDWDPETAYPLYVHLHGLSSTTDRPIDFLTRYFLRDPNSSYGYEDGYYLLPWGRGNLWYQGISETDILECKTAFESMVKIDPQRQYLKGHSMGGYGAWLIASHTPEIWAAIGIEAGALWYGNNHLLNDAVIQQLKDMPTYFVTGTQDGLLGINQQAYDLLVSAGNTQTVFVTFEGGHERLDANEELLYLWIKEYVNEDFISIKDRRTIGSFELVCYPNPCTKSTTFSITMDHPGNAMLSIYTIDGKLIETVVNESLPMGYNKIEYSLGNMSPGLYLGKVEIGDKKYQLKLIIKKE